MDIKSILGYADNSPFRNNPYLDIKTPEGTITMENTSVDLLGIDNLGNVKKMKANSKNPYKFEGTTVREIPLNKNPYMQGGGSMKNAYDFLFGEDEEDIAPEPTIQEDEKDELALQKAERALRERQDNELALEQAELSGLDNPYRRKLKDQYGDDGLDFDEPDTMYDKSTYSGQLSSGKWGNQNIGKHGQRIISDVTNALGYTPEFNSIYRDAAQQKKLVAQGIGATNSWHLTGNAVDMKPADWNKLSPEKKQYFRANYDVTYHNNHYHIEPKG